MRQNSLFHLYFKRKEKSKKKKFIASHDLHFLIVHQNQFCNKFFIKWFQIVYFSHEVTAAFNSVIIFILILKRRYDIFKLMVAVKFSKWVSDKGFKSQKLIMFFEFLLFFCFFFYIGIIIVTTSSRDKFLSLIKGQEAGNTFSFSSIFQIGTKEKWDEDIWLLDNWSRLMEEGGSLQEDSQPTCCSFLIIRSDAKPWPIILSLFKQK